MLMLTEEQCVDTGFKRRLNYYRYKAENLARGDVDDIKKLIDSGRLRGEMFWLARKFYQYLRQHPINTTRLLPRPPVVVNETTDLLNRRLPKTIKAFLVRCSTDAECYGCASSAKDVHDLLQSKFKMPKATLRLMLSQAGIEDQHVYIK